MKKTVLLGAALLAATAALTVPALAGRGDDSRGPDWLTRFDEIDADQDGKLTMDELQANRLAKLTAADADGDGALTATEFATLRPEARAGRMARAFSRMDSDGDGKVLLSDLPMGQGGGEMFTRADTDSDGALSKPEVEAVLAKWAGHRKGKSQD